MVHVENGDQLLVNTEDVNQTYADAFDTQMWKTKGRAENYSGLGWSKNTGLLQFLKEILSLSSSDTLIDFATGNGVVAQALSKEVRNIFAFDISADMMSNSEIGTNGLTNIDLLQASITRVPFQNESADKVTARMVFHHLTDQQMKEALAEAVRVLKSQGTLCIIEYVSTDENCLVLERQVFDIKERNRQLWTAQKMEKHMNKLLADLNLVDKVNVRTVTTVMPQYSVMNWLRNANMREEEIQAIIDLYCNSSAHFKKATNARFISNEKGIVTKYIHRQSLCSCFTRKKVAYE